MSEFSKRLISGIVYVAVFLTAILFCKESYIVLLTLFAGVCLWEFSKMIQSQNILPYLLLGFLGFSLLFDRLYFLEIYNAEIIILIYTLVSLVLLVVDLFVPNFKKQNGLSSLFLPIKYIVLPFLFLMMLPIFNRIYQPMIVVFTIVIIWTNDTFAYLVGKNFGKHKLLEKISPKKTIEGFVGGLFFAVLAGVIIGYTSNNLSILNWVIIAVIVSVFGTLGDLVESKFKRQAGVKDSGTIMPGHGGLLDRLDSLFFLAPFVYLYIHFIL